jgi:hypothetical protein
MRSKKDINPVVTGSGWHATKIVKTGDVNAIDG